jgi:hypothetical protein
MKIEWVVLCREAQQLEPGGPADMVQAGLDYFELASLPHVLRVWLVFRLSGRPEDVVAEHEFCLEVFDPDLRSLEGKQLGTLTIGEAKEISRPGWSLRPLVSLALDLPLQTRGAHTIRVRIGDAVGEAPLYIA